MFRLPISTYHLFIEFVNNTPHLAAAAAAAGAALHKIPVSGAAGPRLGRSHAVVAGHRTHSPAAVGDRYPVGPDNSLVEGRSRFAEGLCILQRRAVLDSMMARRVGARRSRVLADGTRSADMNWGIECRKDSDGPLGIQLQAPQADASLGKQ